MNQFAGHTIVSMANRLGVSGVQTTHWTIQFPVKSSHDTFEPRNDLEQQLLSAQNGHFAITDFVAALVDSQVFVLLDGEVPDSGDLTGVQPLQIADAQGHNVLAVFTSPERSSAIVARLPDFKFGLLVAFRWLLQTGPSNTGLVINPGSSVGLELPASGLARIKRDFEIG